MLVDQVSSAPSLASSIAIFSAGGFFLVGLLTGVWKYAHIARSPDAKAPTYVDTSHRSALLYSFACLLIERFVELSRFSDTIETFAVLAQVIFFALAVFGYLVHGALQDTDNQLARPHRLGSKTIPDGAMRMFMVSLVVAEIGGFVVVFIGALA